jgi:osmoprotectant transport system permease protein
MSAPPPIASIFGETVRWFSDGSHWRGPGGIPHRMFEHVEISIIAVAIASAIALPVALYIGHRRRGEFLAVSVGNVGRALPSFGILALVYPFTLRYAPGSIGFPPTLIALVLLAIPPILTNTYVGIQNVDPDSVEAARGMGMSEREVLSKLELPLAIPLVVAGLRTAAVQVVATATLGALVAWGGLGRFIVDGFAVNDNAEILGGALLVAVLAIATELGFGLLERAVSPRLESKGSRSRALAPVPAVSPGPTS